MLRSLFAALIWAAFALPAYAELNIAPGARLTASSWAEQKLVKEKRDDLPRNAADGSLETGWRAAEGATGQQWLRFDFTRPWPMRYAWQKLVTRWSKPPVSYRWEVSRDGLHWLALASRSKPRTEDTLSVAGTGSYLRLVVPEGTGGLLLEAETYAGSGGSGKVATPTVRLELNQAFLSWSGGTASNVFLYRLTRRATLPLGNSGATAGTTALIEEAPVLTAFDRVDHPTVGSLGFDFRWTVEAYGPDGRRIGRSETTDPLLITERSPRPFAMRGIVEGYYGPGYSDGEREDLIRFTGNQGGNFYLYAPKLDPFHRERWREPYPDDRMQAFKYWNSVAIDQGVRFAWSLSPGLDFDGSAADTQAVVAKYKAFHDMGMRWFGLLMDDIPVEADVTEAVKQVTLANTLVSELRNIDPLTYLLFVPTVYYGTLGGLSPAHKRYLTALQNLDPEIIVMWTGTEVFSPVLTHDLVDPIATLVGHPLVIWDNFPVADYFLGKRANLGAVEGRAVNLGDPVGLNQPVLGLLANPLALPAANRFPLATVLNFLRDPASYSPQSALRDQIKREAPASDVALLERWLSSFATDGLLGIETSEATRAVAGAEAALDGGAWPGEAFAKHAAALFAAEPALRRLYHADMAGDLQPLAAKSGLLGEAELRVLRAMAARAAGTDSSDDLTAAAALLTAAKKSTWIVTEGADERWLDHAMEDKGAPKGRPPVITGALATRVEVGDAVSAAFALGDATTSTLIGLPGASFQHGKVVWHAGHTGVERWVIVAANADGAAVKFGEIAVEQQPVAESGGCASGGAAGWAPLALVPFMLRLRRRRTRNAFTAPGRFG